MKSIFFLLLVAFMYSPAAFGQDEEEGDEKTFNISGSVDVYARTGLGYQEIAPATSFANLKGFSLGMANLIASYEGDDVGFVADLVFGPRGSDAVFNSPIYPSTTGNTSSSIINQMYVYWNVSEGFKLTLGNFNTFLGYEVISPTVNVNYSTSYMFSYGPFSHTGIKADFDLGGGLSGMLAIMNPTDITEFNNVNTYSLGAQLGYTGDTGGAWLNFVYGDQDGNLDPDIDGNGTSDPNGNLFQVDLTTGWDLGESFYLGFNATYQTTAPGKTVVNGDLEDIDAEAGSFLGFAIYPKLTLSENVGLGFRAEYFAISEGYNGIIPVGTDGSGSVIDLTASLNYKIGNLTFIPEVRVDISSEDTAFTTRDGDDSGILPSLTLAAVYAF